MDNTKSPQLTNNNNKNCIWQNPMGLFRVSFTSHANEKFERSWKQLFNVITMLQWQLTFHRLEIYQPIQRNHFYSYRKAIKCQLHIFLVLVCLVRESQYFFYCSRQKFLSRKIFDWFRFFTNEFNCYINTELEMTTDSNMYIWFR